MTDTAKIIIKIASAVVMVGIATYKIVKNHKDNTEEQNNEETE